MASPAETADFSFHPNMVEGAILADASGPQANPATVIESPMTPTAAMSPLSLTPRRGQGEDAQGRLGTSPQARRTATPEIVADQEGQEEMTIVELTRAVRTLTLQQQRDHEWMNEVQETLNDHANIMDGHSSEMQVVSFDTAESHRHDIDQIMATFDQRLRKLPTR